jgi:hypothetical protein
VRPVDPLTKQPKLGETDVVVRGTRRTISDAWLSLWLVIGCKSAKGDPWVLYRNSAQVIHRPTTLETGRESRAADRFVVGNIVGWSDSDWLGAFDPACYAAASTSSGGNNYARSAILAALSAGQGVAEDVPVDGRDATAVILIPVVVVSAPMCAVSLGIGGGYELESTTRVGVRALHSHDEESRRRRGSTAAAHSGGVELCPRRLSPADT